MYRGFALRVLSIDIRGAPLGSAHAISGAKQIVCPDEIGTIRKRAQLAQQHATMRRRGVIHLIVPHIAPDASQRLALTGIDPARAPTMLGGSRMDSTFPLQTPSRYSCAQTRSYHRWRTRCPNRAHSTAYASTGQSLVLGAASSVERLHSLAAQMPFDGGPRTGYSIPSVFRHATAKEGNPCDDKNRRSLTGQSSMLSSSGHRVPPGPDRW